MPPSPGPPPAAADPWVILATLHFNGDVIDAIDPISHRRLVVSLAPLWWSPIASQFAVEDVKVDPPTRTTSNDRAIVNLNVTGTGLKSIQVKDVHFQSNQDQLHVDGVTPNAQQPDQKLTIAVSFAVSPTATTPTPSPQPGQLILTRTDGVMASATVPWIPEVPPPTAAGGGGGGGGAGGGAGAGGGGGGT